MKEQISYKLGEWHVHVDLNLAEGNVAILDQANRPVATVHGDSFEAAFKRGLLVARAPALRDAALACRWLFRRMGEEGRGPFAAAASEMLPMLDAALWSLTEEDD